MPRSTHQSGTFCTCGSVIFLRHRLDHARRSRLHAEGHEPAPEAVRPLQQVAVDGVHTDLAVPREPQVVTLHLDRLPVAVAEDQARNSADPGRIVVPPHEVAHRTFALASDNEIDLRDLLDHVATGEGDVWSAETAGTPASARLLARAARNCS